MPPAAGAPGSAASRAQANVIAEVDAICAAQPHVCSCRELHPNLIIYNRIPKCGSGSVNIFMKSAEERNAYKHARATIYTTRWLSDSQQRRYCANPFQQSQCRKQPTPAERATEHD